MRIWSVTVQERSVLCRMHPRRSDRAISREVNFCVSPIVYKSFGLSAAAYRSTISRSPAIPRPRALTCVRVYKDPAGLDLSERRGVIAVVSRDAAMLDRSRIIDLTEREAPSPEAQPGDNEISARFPERVASFPKGFPWRERYSPSRCRLWRRAASKQVLRVRIAILALVK